MTPIGITELLGRWGVLGAIGLLSSALVATTLLMLRAYRQRSDEVIAAYRDGRAEMLAVAAAANGLDELRRDLQVLVEDARRRLRKPATSTAASLATTVVMGATRPAKPPSSGGQP